MRGVAIARVHLYEKGRAGVGLVTAGWVMGTEPALLAVTGHRLQLCHATPLTQAPCDNCVYTNEPSGEDRYTE